MSHYIPNLFTDVSTCPRPTVFRDDQRLAFSIESPAHDTILTSLSLNVCRKPKDLVSHLRRIYLCFQNALPEPLYAALLDFLIVLDGRGQALSTRMVEGSRSRLKDEQVALLKTGFRNPQTLPGNQFSLFTDGIVGVRHLVEVSKTVQPEYDFLALANDYLQYGQIDEAIATLESGLDENPERLDLQDALLELYRLTHDVERFEGRYSALKAGTVPLSENWQRLAACFSGKTP